MEAKRLFLKDYFQSTYITTRKAISAFFDVIRANSNKNIIVDFSEIEFISRSCADEYIKNKLMLSQKKEIKESNTSEEVSNMFRIVSLQHKKELGIAV